MSKRKKISAKAGSRAKNNEPIRQGIVVTSLPFRGFAPVPDNDLPEELAQTVFGKCLLQLTEEAAKGDKMAIIVLNIASFEIHRTLSELRRTDNPVLRELDPNPLIELVPKTKQHWSDWQGPDGVMDRPRYYLQMARLCITDTKAKFKSFPPGKLIRTESYKSLPDTKPKQRVIYSFDGVETPIPQWRIDANDLPELPAQDLRGFRPVFKAMFEEYWASHPDEYSRILREENLRGEVNAPAIRQDFVSSVCRRLEAENRRL